ncbi:TPA: SatD family protein [Streptococcus suis]
MNYIAIIGDIVNSKQTSNRSSIQERLKQQLNRINHSFAQDFASPFTITSKSFLYS